MEVHQDGPPIRRRWRCDLLGLGCFFDRASALVFLLLPCNRRARPIPNLIA